MFKAAFPLPEQQVNVFINGQTIAVPDGLSVTAAMLYVGRLTARTTAGKKEERSPFCLMGVCQECLMEIDGVPNQQACLVPVREGMRIVVQNGSPNFTSTGEVEK